MVDDIHHLIHGLYLAMLNQIRRGGNTVAHVLAQYARNLNEDLIILVGGSSTCLGSLVS